MKTGKVAKSFGVDPKTVGNWTDMDVFQKFFTPEALGKTGRSQRDYTESDLLVLNTIRAQRALGSDWVDIGTLLESGFREDEFPPQAMLVETTAPIAQYGRIVALMAERDASLAEIERLNSTVNQQSTTINDLQQEIRQLNREIGRMEGRMEYMQEDQNKKN